MFRAPEMSRIFRAEDDCFIDTMAHITYFKKEF
jgi:hypothetical protein